MGGKCDNCGRSTAAVVVLESPKGLYSLCRICYCEPPEIQKPTKAAKGSRAARKAPRSYEEDPLLR